MKKYGHLLFILLTTFLGSPVMAQNNLIGPLIGLNLANVDVDRLAVNGQDITSQIPSNEREVKLDTKSTDFGINLGAGFLFPLTTNYLFIEGQYSNGLTNINAEEDGDVGTLKTKDIQIRIGLLFSLAG